MIEIMPQRGLQTQLHVEALLDPINHMIAMREIMMMKDHQDQQELVFFISQRVKKLVLEKQSQMRSEIYLKSKNSDGSQEQTDSVIQLV